MKRKPQHVSAILPAGSWKGKRVFIIGGGPSLREMSPEDRKALVNEKVIGTNKAFRDFPCDVNVVLDRGLYQKLYFPKKERQKELCKILLDRITRSVEKLKEFEASLLSSDDGLLSILDKESELEELLRGISSV